MNSSSKSTATGGNQTQEITTTNIDLSKVLKRTKLFFLQRGFGAKFAFMLVVAIARLLGALNASLYSFTWSIVTIALVIAPWSREHRSLLVFLNADTENGD